MGFLELSDSVSQLSLPPGFRFFPTDEELLVQYLCRKVAGHHFSLQIIVEIDLYKFDPWILPSKASFGEKEWYFFSPRDRKYPNGTRPNRVAGSGYWKATGTDKLITTDGRKVGIKKALVFYVGKAPKGTKTNWIMHEYRLIEHSRKIGSSKLDDWVLCRIYKKKSSAEKTTASNSSSSSSQQMDELLDSLPETDAKTFLQDPDGEKGVEKKPFNVHTMGCMNSDWESVPEDVNNVLWQDPNYYGFGGHYENELRQDEIGTDGYNNGSGGVTPGGFVNSLGQIGVRYLQLPTSGFGFTRQ